MRTLAALALTLTTGCSIFMGRVPDTYTGETPPTCDDTATAEIVGDVVVSAALATTSVVVWQEQRAMAERPGAVENTSDDLLIGAIAAGSLVWAFDTIIASDKANKCTRIKEEWSERGATDDGSEATAPETEKDL